MDSLRKKIYFASDAHLGARFHKDPLAVEKRLVRWLDSIKDEAMAIYFLGDMFDYWYEYKYVIPKGFVRFLGKLAELSDNGVEIHIFIGNHDIWMFDYLPKEIGAVIHRDVLTLMSDNLPYQKFIDRGYFAVKESVFETGTMTKTYQQTFVTGRGQQFIIGLLKKEFCDNGN